MKSLYRLGFILCFFGFQLTALAAKYRVEHTFPQGGPKLGQNTVIHFSIFRGSDTVPLSAAQMQIEHEKLIHMMVIDTGFQEYLHVHPEEVSLGVWEISILLKTPGDYRTYLQFLPEDEITTKTVSFDARFVEFPEQQVPTSPVKPEQNLTFVDGEFTVTFIPVPGFEPTQKQLSQFYFKIFQNGVEVPFEDLGLYLGAKMHIAGISADKNDFAHAHPGGGDPVGGIDPDKITKIFFQKSGYYGLFMQYVYKGVVHTNQFSLQVKPTPVPTPTPVLVP